MPRTPPRQVEEMGELFEDVREFLVSPASGKVIQAGDDHVSIFMHIYNPHVTVAPINGIVKRIRYEKGSFKPAFMRSSRSNSRNIVEISTSFGDVRVIQIAGFFTRKIICSVRVGQMVAKGFKLGKICFGSRVDVEFPPDFNVVVREKEKVKHGKSVIAVLL